MKILMVLTSHDKLGDTGRKTGFWLQELAAPYYEFKDGGAQITMASPRAVVRRSILRARIPSFQTDITRRFEKDADAEGQLDKTVRLDSVKQQEYDTGIGPDSAVSRHRRTASEFTLMRTRSGPIGSS